jgi:hypothetical protein
MAVSWETVRHQVAIAGIVTNVQTQEKMRGVIVTIEDGPTEFLQWLNLHKKQFPDSWSRMTERPDKTMTSAEGLYYFLDLPDGQYTLQAQLPGAGSRYDSEEVTTTVSHDGDRIVWTDADIQLPTTTLNGQVTFTNDDDEAEGILMAKVQLQGSGDSAFADQDGNYLLTAIEGGERTVVVSAQGYVQTSVTLTIPGDGSVTTHNFSLTPVEI